MLIVEATGVLAGRLSQVYMLLFPQRLVVSGPFVQSPIIRDRLQKLLISDLPRYAPRDFGLELAAHSARDEIVGAAQPLLQKAFLARLDRWTCGRNKPQRPLAHRGPSRVSAIATKPGAN